MHHPKRPEEYVAALLSRYSQPQASAATLLCDGHDSDRVAYTVVSPDLSARQSA